MPPVIPSELEEPAVGSAEPAAARRFTGFMLDLGKLLVFLGILLAVAGVVLMAATKMNVPIGRLPGDILYKGKHTTFYFPLATSLLVSVLLSLLLYFFGRFRR